jgi:hypothetical protein
MKGKRIIDTASARRLRNALVASGMVAAVIAGCSSGDERKRAAALAGGCSINSECQPDLICAFARCHEACKRDYDCDIPLRCVKSRQTDLFVCQLPDETECAIDADCPRGQGCGIDEECRDVCADSDDCVGDQSCDPSGKCASTEPGRDVLDAQGRLIAAESLGAPGAGGADSGSHQGGQGSGDGASPSAGSVSKGGAPSEGGASSEGGAPSDAYPPADYEEQPGVDEPVNNDFREDAIVVTKAVNIYLSKKKGAGLDYDQDADWFAFTVPDDGRGHVITVRMEQEASLQINLKVYAQADGTAIGSQILEMGTLRYAYVTAASGTTALFNFSNYLTAGSKGMAFITFEEEPEADDHEPNNEKATAAPITLGETYVAQALNPFLSESVHPNQDWYALDLAVGSATVTIDSAPTDARLELDVMYPNQGQPTLLKRPEIGGTGSWNFNVTTAGLHYLVIQPSPASGTGGIHSFDYLTKPDYLQTPYSFSVTQ